MSARGLSDFLDDRKNHRPALRLFKEIPAQGIADLRLDSVPFRHIPRVAPFQHIFDTASCAGHKLLAITDINESP